MAQVRPTRFADAARRPPQDDSLCRRVADTVRQSLSQYMSFRAERRISRLLDWDVERKPFTSPFARTLRQPDGCLRMTVSAQV